MKRHGKNLSALLLTLLATLTFHWPIAAQEKVSFLVIAHPEVSIEAISKKQVSRLLLKEVSKWDNGQKAQPVDLDSGSSVRDAFSRAVHGRSVSSIKNFWLRQIFAGNGEPPPEVRDDNAAVSFVRANPGGIGYVSSRANLRGVKVLSVSF